MMREKNQEVLFFFKSIVERGSLSSRAIERDTWSKDYGQPAWQNIVTRLEAKWKSIISISRN
jgi:hypothetical protein